VDEIEIIIDTDGTIRFNAYCLRTDSWHDYKAFLAEAEAAQAAGNYRDANRSLRAAQLFFFAHMEGVLKHICAEKKISDKGRLCDITKRVEAEARKIDSGIASLSFRLGKHLRDIVAHAGLTKEYEDEHGKKETLTQDSVFEKLSVSTLEGLEAIISPWLDRVCQVLAVERFTDTEGRCKGFVELFGELGTCNVQEV
jgi:hypothetical protein